MDPEELFDVVDENNGVVGQATRAQCHAQRLPHRSVMFFIKDPGDRIFVTRRSASKEFFPGFWSIAFGGHLGAGESYETAVGREAMEEAGIEGLPQRIGSFVKTIPEEIEHVEVYGFTVECEPDLCEEEIECGEFCDVKTLGARMESESFLPETERLYALLREWMQPKQA